MTPEQCRRELWRIESGRVTGTKRDLIARVAALAREAEGAGASELARLVERCREIERQLRARTSCFDYAGMPLGEHLRDPIAEKQGNHSATPVRGRDRRGCLEE